MAYNREKRGRSEEKDLLSAVRETKWLFYCKTDKTTSTFPAQHSSWPKSYSLLQKISLQPHTTHHLFDPKTKKLFEYEVIAMVNDEEITRAQEKCNLKIFASDETIENLTVSMQHEERNLSDSIPHSDSSESEGEPESQPEKQKAKRSRYEPPKHNIINPTYNDWPVGTILQRSLQNVIESSTPLVKPQVSYR